jgi:hypothetical protein
MKNWWVAQSARINALSLRERVFMFFSVLVCCLAVVDVVWLSPAQMTHKQLKQQFEKQTNELKRMRSELRSRTRQRLELTVSGPYPELMRYVRSLETALPYIRWAGFSLKSEKQVSVLTLHLFLVDVQR